MNLDIALTLGCGLIGLVFFLFVVLAKHDPFTLAQPQRSFVLIINSLIFAWWIVLLIGRSHEVPRWASVFGAAGCVAGVLAVIILMRYPKPPAEGGAP